MNRFFKIGAVSLLAVAPAMALAETLTDVGNTISSLVDLATPIVVALALVYFFWGLAQLLFNIGDEGKRKKAIEIMIYGVIALFVMVSVWGIVNVLQETFHVGGSQSITPPSVNQR